MKNFENIVKELTKRKETIATMESCTGGAVANAITSIEGASSVIKFSAITYSNEYKIKMGVDANVIDKYSVYSIETAKEMAKNISLFTNATYGIGITGKLKRADKNNDTGNDNEVFISIYNDGRYTCQTVSVYEDTRDKNKNIILNRTIEMLENILMLNR